MPPLVEKYISQQKHLRQNYVTFFNNVSYVDYKRVYDFIRANEKIKLLKLLLSVFGENNTYKTSKAH